MLNIYYGAETTDKEKFIFDNIKGKTLLLVPDQFSLQAERDAFFYLEKKSLMDLRIVDFSTLGHKVAREAGGMKPQMIDKYGSQMLLTKVIGEVNEELKIYKGLSWKSSFVDMIYGAISDMKRYGIEPDALTKVIDELDENSYLKYKLEDIKTIYEKYQSLIEGKYLDAEDFITFYGEKIINAPMVTESEIWIFGFDTFTPKNLLVIEKLIKAARKVNIVMTYEDNKEIFSLTRHVMNKLTGLAEAIDAEVKVEEIPGSGEKDELPITMVAASNPYTEAERAAEHILTLVRDHGYRYGDIVLVCNDMDGRGNVLRRTFNRWGIPVFIDKKRKVMHHPAVGCLLAVMDIVSKGYRTEAVMRMIKSGLMGFSHEEGDLLENYVSQFKINGTGWKNQFTRTGGKYDEEKLELLNNLRQTVVDTVENAKEAIGKYNTASEKTKGLYSFLEGDFAMVQRIEGLIVKQEEAGFSEAASETAQSWNVICNILDQVVEILGDEKVSNEEFTKLMTIGFEQVEIGLVPVSTDRVIMGTLQRTRLSRVKVLLVVGANAGILPMETGQEGLISDREKALLEEHQIELSKRDEVSRREEKLAINRAFHLPQERLYVSCSGVNQAGEAARPAEIFEQIKEYLDAKGALHIFHDIEDGYDSGDGEKTGAGALEMLICSEGTLGYMTDAIRKYADGEEIDRDWLKIVNWYGENKPEELERVAAGMAFDNHMEPVGEAFADALYRGDRDKLEVSASRLEKYSGCPFAHFVMYGLRAETQEVYEMGAREIGDIYHYCLMKLSKRLTPTADTGMAVDHPSSPWMNITEVECRKQIEDIIANDMDGFNEGILDLSKAESYRTKRIAEICGNAAWSMIKQVRKGHIRSMYFEEPFGRGKTLPPITVETGGKQVLIKGKIDRLDVLHEDAVRVVDYKTGSDTVDVEYIRNGYKLQLMIYLKAAVEGNLAAINAEHMPSETEPAGVFYFKIDDLESDADQKNVEADSEVGRLSHRLDESYKLVGIVLDDEQIACAMDNELGEEADTSTVIPVKYAGKEKTLKASAGGHLMNREEFNELMEAVESQVERICTEIYSGEIDVKPKKERKQSFGEQKTACSYCKYKSICMFDTTFKGCRFELI